MILLLMHVFYIFPIMLALYLMLSVTHQAQIYAGIIGVSLTTGSVGPVNGINKDVSSARLLPTTVSIYLVD